MLLTLPDELIEVIIKFLPKERLSLIRLALVSRLLRDITSQTHLKELFPVLYDHQAPYKTTRTIGDKHEIGLTDLSQDGTMLALNYQNNSYYYIKLFDAYTGELLSKLKTYETIGCVYVKMKFNWNNEFLICLAVNGRFDIWDLKKNNCLKQIESGYSGNSDEKNDFAFISNYELICSTSSNQIGIFNFKTGELKPFLITSLQFDKAKSRTFCLSDDKTKLVIFTQHHWPDGKSVSIYDMQALTFITKFTIKDAWIIYTHCYLTPDNQTFGYFSLERNKNDPERTLIHNTVSLSKRAAVETKITTGLWETRPKIVNITYPNLSFYWPSTGIVPDHKVYIYNLQAQAIMSKDSSYNLHATQMSSSGNRKFQFFRHHAVIEHFPHMQVGSRATIHIGS